MDKIRIELKSFDSKLINQSCTQILENIKQTNSSVFGPIGLPTKKRIYCTVDCFVPLFLDDSKDHYLVAGPVRFRYLHLNERTTHFIPLNIPIYTLNLIL